MQIKRTANAGVLLGLDGKSILLDGVCQEVKPYLATPAQMYEALLRDPPDAIAFSHTHPDHYWPSFVSDYLQKAAGPVIGPADIAFADTHTVRLGTVRIIPVQCRHLGRSEQIAHRSYIIQGSRCVWFMGDATTEHWLEQTQLPHPDVMIAPYAFASGHGWQVTKELNPDVLVLVHMPEKDQDIHGIWDGVTRTVGKDKHPMVIVPEMGQTVQLYASYDTGHEKT